ncbi:hypothetical protein B0O99DRAFT_665061 [Bisporella sp. PMI_857]|nr:hypothetical protein B0O99DRAFT_665061 [Bisporella sp. PMI_857]
MSKRVFSFDHSQDPATGAQKRRKTALNDAQAPASDTIQRKANGDYTVGWICAISTEYVAAQAFLDERHDRPEYVSDNDNNDYTLGKIGEHNVVIAVLPDGEYGTASAAMVARDMLHSFPNIRIGLMRDIRLGDIVVSAPRDGKGGMFYFHTTGFLNLPPTVLRTAMNGLKAQYESDGHQLNVAINRILEKKRRLRRKYERPEPSTDRLYQAQFTHPPNDEALCAAVCGDNPSSLMLRYERTEDEDNPTIHYGLIASGNQLMKDALTRDRLAAEEDVLCFEMEAAGLMNHFPCLVIRGVCDYSDSHKNKTWQGYAAMAAAAYAKDLLRRIPPNKVGAEKRATFFAPVIEKDLNKMHITIQDASVNVNTLRIEHRRQEIERWLRPPDPSTNWAKALQQRHKGSGLWFLRNEAFAKWKTQRNSFLWLYGIPGCGKTILSSAIIDDLERTSESPTTLYFYFDFNDTSKQSFENSLFFSCGNGNRQPTTELLCASFLDMIQQAGEICIVLDALDECCTRKGTPAERLLSWIKSVVSPKYANVSLLVTSRREQDIESAISEWDHNKTLIPIKSGLVTDDIREYVRTRVRENDGLKRWRSRSDIQKEIETELMKKADGMFRWATCQLDTLENCLDYPTLQKALASLPKTLDDTYARTLRAIPYEYKQSAIRILQILTFSERPLQIEDRVPAGCSPWFNPKNRMPEPTEITRYCSSMVTIETRTTSKYSKEMKRKLQLAHFSVKEYLTFGRLEESFTQYLQESAARASITKKAFPLAQHCARYWMRHAAMSKIEDKELHRLIMDLFLRHKMPYTNWYRLCDPDLAFGGSPSRKGGPADALYNASIGGLKYEVKELIRQGADVNAKGEFYGSALQAASEEGNEKIVRMLLDNSADVNAQGGEYGNALQAASEKGYEKVVQMLLDNGANANAQNGGHSNALRAASGQGHGKIVQMLLDNGADVNAQNGEYGNALYAASGRGHEKAVQMLLDNGADVNIQGGFYGSALQAASKQGHEKIVQILLNNSADINAQSGWYGNALQVASGQGEYGNALYAASGRGHEKIVQMLLDNGADINAQGGVFGNALQAASEKGHEKIVQMLAEYKYAGESSHFSTAFQVLFISQKGDCIGKVQPIA